MLLPLKFPSLDKLKDSKQLKGPCDEGPDPCREKHMTNEQAEHVLLILYAATLALLKLNVFKVIKASIWVSRINFKTTFMIACLLITDVNMFEKSLLRSFRWVESK